MNFSLANALILLVATVGISSAGILPLTAQETEPVPASQKNEQSERLLKRLLQRMDKIESKLEQLQVIRRDVPQDPKDQKIISLLETPYTSNINYDGSGQTRFFAAKLILVNLTPQPVTLKREEISLMVDGTHYPFKKISGNVLHHSFQIGNQHFQLRNLKTSAQLKLAPGGTASTWIVFSGLPGGKQIPKLLLELKIAGKKSRLDVNEFAMGMLGLEIERIGPRGSLALLTISGAFNTINAGGFADVLQNLTTQKIGRVVVRWTESATPLDHQILNWLQQSAIQAGRAEVSHQHFPIIPANIQELHLAKIPSSDSGHHHHQPNTGTPRIHASDLDAVNAALRTAYEVLPRNELLAEIENGHPLTRAAALAGGGGRLSDDKLPVILEYTEDNDVKMQRAALIALRHFGDPRAIEKLLFFARKNVQPLSTAALESLAASRFAAAQKGLLEILNGEDPESRKNIVKVIARYPRPLWAESIYEFAQDPKSEVAAEALVALTRIGHPKLIEVFALALEKGDDTLQSKAFELLAQRTDPQSEELAMNHLLGYLKQSAPTPSMYALLNRTKDRRAIPLLLAQMKKSNDHRSSLINTLTQIGDQTVAAEFVKMYPRLQDHEKQNVLSSLQQMKAPEYRQLAGEALTSGNSSLVSTACQGLQADGSAEAVAMLIAAFEKTNDQNGLSYLANALGTLATPPARKALLQARESGNKYKQQTARRALRQARLRSPAMHLVNQAMSRAKQKKWDEAIKQFTVAIKVDPELPEAYSGRGNAYLHKNKYSEAKKDYTQALKLDPYHGMAITGVGICLVMEGKIDEGVKRVEDSREQFQDDMTFAYNTACVYGLALQQVKQNEKIADREKRLTAYPKKAFEDLNRSVKLGFRDFKLMKEDPDLKELRALPEFKKLLAPNAAAKPAGRTESLEE